MDPLIVSIIIGTAIAGFVQGLSGFAFTMVAMAIWAWTMEPRLATALAVFGGMAGQMLSVVTIRRGFDTRVLIPLLLGAAIGIPIGVSILPLLDADLFKTLLGLALTICCPILLASGRLPHIRADGKAGDGLVGVIAGTMGGIGGFTGIMPTLWYTLRGFDKDRLRSVVQTFNLAALTTTMIVYAATGLATREMLPLFVLIVPAMLIPWWIGSRVYLGIDEITFRRVVLGLLAISGVAMLVASLPDVIARLI